MPAARLRIVSLPTLFAALFLSLLAASAVAQSQTALILTTDPIVDPGLPFQVTAYPLSRAAVQNAEVILTLPAGVTYASGPDFCTAAGDRVVCTIAELPANPRLIYPLPDPQATLRVRLNASGELSGGTLTLAGELRGAGTIPSTQAVDVALYRTFLVSTTADAGPGSLREALTTANQVCGGQPTCKVGFAIAGTLPDGVATIALSSPLPAIDLKVLAIDGAVQTRRIGDSNPDGPEIELRGEQAGAAGGLRFTNTCNSIVRGLAIGGFTGNAVELAGNSDCRAFLTGRHVLIEDNYLGLDAHGREARPNLRGVFASGPALVRRGRAGGKGALLDVRPFMIEVGTEDCSAPPSEPDWRISRIRLSGQWAGFTDWRDSMCASTKLKRPCC